ncbi:Hypothetical_protein [Hexamita inflata]|uniref:Hypothetical_protein n=1 Tax=Hexamita inflata TaxID=28002 RepID=A0AA86UI76_9EUKA|nr:Hypothetical protein HINF_LOCUS39842 [Hexamita inflata]
MLKCTLVQTKILGSRTYKGFYQIQNSCIYCNYFSKDEQIDLFYRLSDLKSEQMGDERIYYDPKQKLQIITPLNEIDSLPLTNNIEESDQFIQYYPSGYKSYEDLCETPNSFNLSQKSFELKNSKTGNNRFE